MLGERCGETDQHIAASLELNRLDTRRTGRVGRPCVRCFLAQDPAVLVAPHLHL